MKEVKHCPRCGSVVEGDFCPRCDLHSTATKGVIREKDTVKENKKQSFYDFSKEQASKVHHTEIFHKQNMDQEDFEPEFDKEKEFQQTVGEAISKQKLEEIPKERTTKQSSLHAFSKEEPTSPSEKLEVLKKLEETYDVKEEQEERGKQLPPLPKESTSMEETTPLQVPKTMESEVAKRKPTKKGDFFAKEEEVKEEPSVPPLEEKETIPTENKKGPSLLEKVRNGSLFKDEKVKDDKEHDSVETADVKEENNEEPSVVESKEVTNPKEEKKEVTPIFTCAVTAPKQKEQSTKKEKEVEEPKAESVVSTPTEVPSDLENSTVNHEVQEVEKAEDETDSYTRPLQELDKILQIIEQREAQELAQKEKAKNEETEEKEEENTTQNLPIFVDSVAPNKEEKKDSKVTSTSTGPTLTKEEEENLQKQQKLLEASVPPKEPEEKKPGTPKKKRYWPWVLLVIILLAIAGGGYYYHLQKEHTEVQQAYRKIERQIDDYYVGDKAKDGFVAKNMSAKTIANVKDEIANLEKKDPEKASDLTKQLQELQKNTELTNKINDLFVSPILKGDKIEKVGLKDNVKVEFVPVKNPSTPFEKAVNECILDAKGQAEAQKEAKDAVSNLYEGKEVKDKVTSEDCTDAEKLVDKVQNTSLKKSLQKKLKQVKEVLDERKEEAEEKKKAEEAKKEAEKAEKETKKKADEASDKTGPYAWAKGVKEQVINTCIERGYITPDGYSLEKAFVRNGEGYYNLYGTNNRSRTLSGYPNSNIHVYLVTINCKTGWFKGNGNG